ncbi:hypothetical protein [Yersinia enterocolitica]|uniref:hypothetical protein n=1 Tax=Yersinia enterocolitica TaxID=630 RepID=UPI0029BF58D7|nr:hypothetical protein [Yersinia enterocolitica]EKN4114374.1 hypothetical protein [Yersinia enterocolitica]EKN4898399.1 hypothetical protein [Yersinia enterocolitica]EKN5151283.1 hypothetical protein [Yersinia enterocolitica]EKN6244538.1 hypothetical protein [Yersinia enterocolitica]
MYKEINKSGLLNSAILILTLISTNEIIAANEPVYKSIYNVNHGALIYSHNHGQNQYLWADYAHNLSGDWKANANWNLMYNSDGTISFVNQNSGLCLQYYGTNYQIVEHKCTGSHEKQKFNFELISSGAILIKFAHNSECIYMSSGIRYYSIYSDVCDQTNKDFYWAIVPPLAP